MTQVSGQGSLLHAVIGVLAASETPLKAREIVERLGGEGDRTELRREVNRLLFGPLASFVVQDSSSRWILSRAPEFREVKRPRLPTPPPESSSGPGYRVDDINRVPVSPDILRRVQSKLDLWKRELIEFGRRNKLLYFNSSRRTRLHLSLPKASTLYEGLVLRDKSFSFAVPVRGDVDQAELEEETAPLSGSGERSGDIVVDYSTSSATDVRSLQRKLFRLRSDARSTLNELGINTLHLSIGVLRWRETDTAAEWIESPVLLVPVTLDREKNGPYRLAGFEGDVVINPALAHRLRHDFDLEVPSFDPFDGFGEHADLDGYLSELSGLVDGRGWAVAADVWLSHFSFEKLVMYEDLSEPGTAEEIARHPVLAAISGVGEVDVPEVTLEEVQAAFELPDTYPVVDADSSQVEVIARVRAGQSLVVQGPPGTGKSQTIVNLIAQAIRDEKSVLFVSEKRAALDIVQRRLREAKLADLCLELHSHRTDKREVVKDLHFAMQGSMETIDEPAHGRFEERRTLRERLDAYVRALHKKRGAGERTAFEVHGELAALADAPFVDAELPISSWVDATDEFERAVCGALHQLVVTDLWDREDQHPWREAVFEEPPFVTRQAIEPAVELLRHGLVGARQVTDRYAKVVGEPCGATSLQMLEGLDRCLASLTTMPEGVSPAWLSCNEARFSEIARTVHEAEDATERALERATELAEARAEPLARARDTVPPLLQRYRESYASLFARLSSGYRRDRESISQMIGRKPRYREAIHALEVATGLQEMEKRLEEDRESILAAIRREWPMDAKEREQLIEALAWTRAHRQLLDAGRHSEAASNRLVEDTSGVVSWATEARLALEGSAGPWRQAVARLAHWFPNGLGGVPLEDIDLDTLMARADQWVASAPLIDEWTDYYRALQACIGEGLEPFLMASRRGGIRNGQLERTLRKLIATRWILEVYAGDRSLGRFSPKGHESVIKDFAALDVQLLEDARQATRHGANQRQEIVRQAARFQDLSHGRYRQVPNRAARDEYVLVKKEYGKRRMHIPLRRLLPQLPTILPAVKPCLLMSPLSVASYLPRRQFRFDLVIFDEASQVLPADALGAILRGKQLVVFGDSKQLPPTSFFQRHLDGDEYLDDEEASEAVAFESILDISAACLPGTGLRWHYRSRDERLIAFSNRTFYSDRPLITFPNPDLQGDTGVRFHYVPTGLYDRGGSRTNIVEAQRVVDLVLQHFERHGWRRSLGVIALSLSQRDAIELELRRRLLARPDLEPFISETGSEPFFIKNLETVQGDERDEIIVGLGYGPSEPGGIPALAFGPVNASGGERRLNVAITRAKFGLTLVSSMRPEQLDRATDLASTGPRVLAAYMRYVAQDGRFEADAVIDPTRVPQSPFEEAVKSSLESRGYEVDPQVGASSFRIDLAVRNPDVPTRHILGIECDGATYHRAASARDRDRLRQQLLEGMGWRIHRIWSTDWIQHPEIALQVVVDRIEGLRLEDVSGPVISPVPAVQLAAPSAPLGPESPAIEPERLDLQAPFIREQRESLLFEQARLELHVTTYRESQAALGAQSDKGFADAQLEHTLEQRLSQIHDALSRIDEGTYGRCLRCGSQIEPERLEAVPSTPLCRECAQLEV